MEEMETEQERERQVAREWARRRVQEREEDGSLRIILERLQEKLGGKMVFLPDDWRQRPQTHQFTIPRYYHNAIHVYVLRSPKIVIDVDFETISRKAALKLAKNWGQVADAILCKTCLIIGGHTTLEMYWETLRRQFPLEELASEPQWIVSGADDAKTVTLRMELDALMFNKTIGGGRIHLDLLTFHTTTIEVTVRKEMDEMLDALHKGAESFEEGCGGEAGIHIHGSTGQRQGAKGRGRVLEMTNKLVGRSRKLGWHSRQGRSRCRR